MQQLRNAFARRPDNHNEDQDTQAKQFGHVLLDQLLKRLRRYEVWLIPPEVVEGVVELTKREL